MLSHGYLLVSHGLYVCRDGRLVFQFHISTPETSLTVERLRREPDRQLLRLPDFCAEIRNIQSTFGGGWQQWLRLDACLGESLGAETFLSSHLVVEMHPVV